jgi:signal transduction histidine kinase
MSLQNHPQPVAWVLLAPNDIGYRVVQANKDFASLVGYDVNHLVGASLWDLLADGNYADLRAKLKSVLKTPNFATQTHLSWPTQQAHFELTTCSVSNAIVLVCRDISADAGSEQAYQDLRLLLKKLVTYGSALLLTLDRPLLTVANIEHVPSELFWLKPAEVLGSNLNQLFGEVFFNLAKDALEQASNSQDMVHPKDVIIEQGKVKWFGQMIIFPLNHEQAAMVVFKSPEALQDVQKLRAAKQLAETLSRSKSFFLANIGHELRSPLTGILGFAELMLGPDFKANDLEKIQEYAGFIQDSGRGLLKIVDDIIDLSRIESNRFDLREGPVDLNNLVKAAKAQHDKAATHKKLDVALKLGAIPIFRGDVRATKKIVYNLLANAVKYTPIGGKIWLETLMDSDLRINLLVKDTGHGMDERQIQRALLPYAQFDSSLTRKQGGTGLGLPLVRALADLHQADLRIISAPDKGTECRVIYPMARNVDASS